MDKWQKKCTVKHFAWSSRLKKYRPFAIYYGTSSWTNHLKQHLNKMYLKSWKVPSLTALVWPALFCLPAFSAAWITREQNAPQKTSISIYRQNWPHWLDYPHSHKHWQTHANGSHIQYSVNMAIENTETSDIRHCAVFRRISGTIKYLFETLCAEINCSISTKTIRNNSATQMNANE